MVSVRVAVWIIGPAVPLTVTLAVVGGDGGGVELPPLPPPPHPTRLQIPQEITRMKMDRLGSVSLLMQETTALDHFGSRIMKLPV